MARAGARRIYQELRRFPPPTAAGCVVAMPKSASDVGWGTGNDEQTVTETLRLVREELPVDDRRIAAGGAFGRRRLGLSRGLRGLGLQRRLHALGAVTTR